MNAGGGRPLGLLHHAMGTLLHPSAVIKLFIYFLPYYVMAFSLIICANCSFVARSRRAQQVQKLHVGFLIPKGFKQHEGRVARGATW
jgi:hypothetical protein